MALYIRSDEVDRLARELTAATGEGLTEAVGTALRERAIQDAPYQSALTSLSRLRSPSRL